MVAKFRGKKRFLSEEPMSHMEGMISAENVICHAVVEPNAARKVSIENDWEGIDVYSN